MSEPTYSSREERKQVEKSIKTRENKVVKKHSLLKKVCFFILVALIVSTGVGAIAFAAMIKGAPALDSSKLVDPLSTKFYDKNGTFVYEYGKEKRTKIKYDAVPKTLEHAFIATEDAHFYEHNGVDIKGTLRAIFKNLTGDFGSQGGSTITQQVIKNSFLTPQKTIKRKVQEWSLAHQLEQKYTKHQILMMYLNKIYLGDGAYGIAAAAKIYYGIDANQLNKLTLPQAAMLAGLPQSPSAYDPSKPEHIKAATNRRNLVLSAMYKQGYISKKQMDDAKKVPVTAGLLPKTPQQGMRYEAFMDAAVKEVEGKLKDVDISTDGLSIYMTLDAKAQDYADKIMNTNTLISYPNANFQGAFVFLDTKTGEVRAIGSGRNDYQANFRGNNFAIDLKRQPGSTFKPIFDYGPAIENLKWSTAHQLDDHPITYSNGQSIANWDHRYHGILSARTALAMSYNIPALLTLREVGMDKAAAFAKNLGITFDDNKVYESFAIGSNTVNPLEMAGAYSAFGNNGNYNKPHFVSKVVFPNGKVVNLTPKPKRVMQDYTAYLVTDMLRSVVTSGTGKTALVPGLDVAGKTGTTNFDANTRSRYGYPTGAVNDSWFVGYTPQYTMAVWTGYSKNGQGNYLEGNTTKISQQMFKVMMQQFGSDRSSFIQPNDVYRLNNELYIQGGEAVPKLPGPSKGDEPKGKEQQKWNKEGGPKHGPKPGKGKHKH